MLDSSEYMFDDDPGANARRLRDDLRKAPSVFILYARFRRALRSQHRLRKGLPSVVVVIVDTEEIGDAHRKAAEYVLTGRIEQWPHMRRNSKACVHVIERPSKTKFRLTTSILDILWRHELHLVLARNMSEVPEELAILADGIVNLQPPTAAHINAVRQLMGRSRLDETTAAMIARLDLAIMVPLACKQQVTIDVVSGLVNAHRGSVGSAIPRLEELPGYRGAREWAMAFIEDVQCFKRGQMDWSHMDRGVLLCGPPGTGKTLFVQALAKSSGLPLISASVSQWQSFGHLGDMLGAMRKTFETAQAQQPSIVFLDELDAIGDRTKFPNHHANYSSQVVNYLLESIDGAGGRHQMIVIGATNFPEAIDPALLRSGRLERHISLGLPDAGERLEILQFHLKLREEAKELSEIAADLDGWNGADLEMIAREAKRIARRYSRPVQISDVVKALPPVHELSDESLRRIAVHEAGHVVVAHGTAPNARMSVSIRRRGRSGSSQALRRGGTVRYELPETDWVPDTRDQLESLICRKLAGAAAEEYILGSRSIGFSGSKGSDLDEATILATRMVASYGMGHGLTFQIEASQVTVESGRMLPDAALENVSRILDQQYSRATALLTENSSLLERVADELVRKGALTVEDVDAILAGGKIGTYQSEHL